MPQVQVNLYATLRKYVDGARPFGGENPSPTDGMVEVEIEAGQTVEAVLKQLGVPPDQTRIIFVNNRAADLSRSLQGGEKIGVFPAIGGG